MASTFTDLGLELMATGENAGTWGEKTNANLNLIEQLTGGVLSLSIAGGAGNQDLTIIDGNVTGTAQQRILEFTGTISGARVIRFPLLTETFYFIKNGTSGAHTVQIKAISGSGATVTFAADDKGYKIIYFDGVATNTGAFEIPLTTAQAVTLTGTQTLTNKTLTDPKLTPTATTAGKVEFLEGTNNGTNKATLIGPAATADVTVTLPAATDTLVGKATTDTLTNKTINASQLINATVSIAKLANGTDGNLISYDANGAAVAVATGNSGQVLTSAGAGAPPTFEAASAGISWVTTPKTSSFTVTAGEGYFMNSGSALTVSLPAGQAGATFAIADYARNFATNNLTISPNGSEKIGGIAEDATLNVDGQAATFVYVDGTKGWINVQNAEDTETGTPPFIQATGGTITQSGNFRIHTFNSPGTFQVTKIATESPAPIYNIVSYAVSAGGGGSGGSINNVHVAAGGGGGGYRGGRNQPVDSYTESPLCASSGLAVSAQSYSVVVGAGGAGGCGVTRGTNGVNSVFQSITSAGGGGGGAIGSPGAPACRAGRPGGSGGGGSSQTAANGGTGNTPPVSPAQGTNGGAGTDAPPDLRGGGGGGATATGGTGSPAAIQGRGGAGATTTISGSSLGYSGGGSAGGTGGGGPGAGAAASPCGSGAAGQPKCSPFDGNNATNNRGGGGGGSAANPSAPGSPGNFPGGNGGSGVVIIRYRFQ